MNLLRKQSFLGLDTQEIRPSEFGDILEDIRISLYGSPDCVFSKTAIDSVVSKIKRVVEKNYPASAYVTPSERDAIQQLRDCVNSSQETTQELGSYQNRRTLRLGQDDFEVAAPAIPTWGYIAGGAAALGLILLLTK